MALRRALLLAGGLALGLPAPPSVGAARPAAPAVTLVAGCEVVYDRGVSAFTATLRNVGTVSASVTLGSSAGGEYHPTKFSVAVTGRDAPDVFRYSAGLGAEGATPWSVTMAPGGVHRVRLAAVRMLSARTGRAVDLGYLQGEWTVRLILHGVAVSYADSPRAPLPLLSLATGTVESPRLDVPAACDRVRAR